LARTVQPQGMGSQSGDCSETMRLKGGAVETIKLDIELDATDQLEKGESNAVSMGVYPQLSALEMMVYPKSALVIANTALMFAVRRYIRDRAAKSGQKGPTEQILKWFFLIGRGRAITNSRLGTLG
jgi:hypothetical protein